MLLIFTLISICIKCTKRTSDWHSLSNVLVASYPERELHRVLSLLIDCFINSYLKSFLLYYMCQLTWLRARFMEIFFYCWDVLYCVIERHEYKSVLLGARLERNTHLEPLMHYSRNTSFLLSALHLIVQCSNHSIPQANAVYLFWRRLLVSYPVRHLRFLSGDGYPYSNAYSAFSFTLYFFFLQLRHPQL